jgi:hypothetical protein
MAFPEFMFKFIPMSDVLLPEEMENQVSTFLLSFSSFTLANYDGTLSVLSDWSGSLEKEAR